MHASIYQATIGSDNWPHAIILTNADLFSIGSLGAIVSEIRITIQPFSRKKSIQNKKYNNVVNEMATILSRHQFVKWSWEIGVNHLRLLSSGAMVAKADGVEGVNGVVNDELSEIDVMEWFVPSSDEVKVSGTLVHRFTK